MQNSDPLYLFVCHLEWRTYAQVAAHNQLIAALEDPDPSIRELAKHLLRRRSSRPRNREDHLQNGSSNAKSY